MITIFTATYNRSTLLQRVYESLENQTNKNFCWLIVDDGSSDDTKIRIADMKKNASFPINYIYQKNEGKPFAFNKGVENTETEYFFSLDSDDWLKSDAVEIIIETINTLNLKKEVAGYVFQAATKDQKILTTENFPSSPWYSGFFEMINTYHILGDTSIVYKTDLLKNNLFPRYNKEKFVPEALVLHRLEQNASFCFINEVIKYVEYQDDGFSANMNELFKRNPEGYYNYCLELLNFYKPSLKQTGRHIAAVGVFGKKIGKSNKEIRLALKRKKDRILYVILLPAILLYKL